MSEVVDGAEHAVHKVGEGAAHGAEKTKSVLGRKIGPLPLGAWILAVLGGVAVALYLRGQSTEPDAPDAPDAELPNDTQAGVGGSRGGYDPAPTPPPAPVHHHHRHPHPHQPPRNHHTGGYHPPPHHPPPHHHNNRDDGTDPPRRDR